jgi:general secretion pathway protein H
MGLGRHSLPYDTSTRLWVITVGWAVPAIVLFCPSTSALYAYAQDERIFNPYISEKFAIMSASSSTSTMKQRVFQALLRNRRASGFTLLELILVLVIVAVAATLVAPAIGNRFTSADPRQTIVQLRAAMELMRVRAIEEGKEEVLVVAAEEGRYWHEGGDGEVLVPPESGELRARGRFTRETGEVEFHFYPDGTNSGGEVRIEKSRSEGGKIYGLTLNPLLGTATIRRDN